ncbi:MAG TPA: hypothetical protein VEU08_21835 [Vicinamibacterales bacterium]|nr:hypothetical protein [Vicinamibacterales bacterium]
MRLTAVLAVALVAGTTSTGRAIDPPTAASAVHEWGTFTSIAGVDGRPVQWTPLAGPSDLPCFVVRNRLETKGSLRGTVRMETPVLYFYAEADTRASVRVRFNGGAFTEWFPPASVTGTPMYAPNRSAITWAEVNVRPNLPAEFPVESGSSHYYRARDTDASPLVSAGERERFLFYRGVGTFPVPIAAIVAGDGSVLVSSPPGDPVGDVVLFENRGGAIASEVQHLDASHAVLAPSAPLTGNTPPLEELEQILVAHGLFEREAHAMVETWRDSWFEEGARLIYIVPAALVDRVLPLEIAPAPDTVRRVFVGRLELITPATLKTVGDAVAAGDQDVLARFGRFLEPIVKQLGEKGVSIPWPSDHCPVTAS